MSVQPWRLLTFIALLTGSGCGASISNALFLEEAEFLAALPGEERLAAPASIFLAPNGNAEPLRAAKEAATDWDRLVAVLAASGDGLREAAEGAERSEVARRWEDVNVAHRFGTDDPLGFLPASEDWFVDGEILRLGETTFEWSLSLSATADADPITVASGVHEAAGGTFTWDGDAAAEALGVLPPTEVGVLDVDYALAIGDSPLPTVEATQELGAGTGRSFTIAGTDLLAFDGADLSMTNDGAAWPAAAVVVHGEGGGRAEGFVIQEDVPRAFTSCWDGLGETTWSGGDEAIVTEGAESTCAVGPILTP